jgi:hypothetical protein
MLQFAKRRMTPTPARSHHVIFPNGVAISSEYRLALSGCAPVTAMANGPINNIIKVASTAFTLAFPTLLYYRYCRLYKELPARLRDNSDICFGALCSGSVVVADAPGCVQTTTEFWQRVLSGCLQACYQIWQRVLSACRQAWNQIPSETAHTAQLV